MCLMFLFMFCVALAPVALGAIYLQSCHSHGSELCFCVVPVERNHGGISKLELGFLVFMCEKLLQKSITVSK